MRVGFLTLLFAQVIVAAMLAATVWAAGAIGTIAWRRGATAAGAMPWGVTMAVGFAVIAQALLLAGLIGMLRAPVVIAIVAGIHVAAIPAWRRAAHAATARGFASAATGVGLAAAMLPAFVLTLYPPLGFDQTMYHLPYARAFAASGGVPFLPALRFPIFPQLSEVLNAAVLLVADDVATQAAGWVALVAGVSLAWTWARELADGEPPRADMGAGAGAGWLAAAIIVGSPIAVYLAATGYVEPLLALLGGASLYAAGRAKLVNDAERVRWLVVAGLLAGSAASVKYHGLYVVPAAALLVIRRGPWRASARELAIYGVVAIVAMLPSYGRLIAHTGNPVFPFFPELFGANPWAADIIMGPRGADRWRLAVTRLWDVTFRRELVGGMPHYSPAFLLGLPIVLIAAWRHARFRRPLVIAIGYILLAPVHAHHLFAIAVLWSALTGAAAATLMRTHKTRRALLIAAAIIVASGGEAYALYRLHRLGLPPATFDARERLMASQRPLYPAIAWLNRTAGPVTVYAIHSEVMVDYASGTLLGDHNGPASFAIVEARVRETGNVASALDTIDADYLLVPTLPAAAVWREQAARDPRLTRVYEDGAAIIFRRGAGRE